MGGNPGVHTADLLEAAVAAAGVLEAAGVDFALCGGLAAYARGGTLIDHDVDSAIPAEQADLLIDLIFRPVERPVTTAMLADSDILPLASARLPVLSGTELLINSLGTVTDQDCDFSEPLRLARAIREQIDLDRVRDETKQSPYSRAFLALAEDLHVLTGRQDG